MKVHVVPGLIYSVIRTTQLSGTGNWFLHCYLNFLSDNPAFDLGVIFLKIFYIVECHSSAISRRALSASRWQLDSAFYLLPSRPFAHWSYTTVNEWLARFWISTDVVYLKRCSGCYHMKLLPEICLGVNRFTEQIDAWTDRSVMTPPLPSGKYYSRRYIKSRWV